MPGKHEAQAGAVWLGAALRRPLQRQLRPALARLACGATAARRAAALAHVRRLSSRDQPEPGLRRRAKLLALAFTAACRSQQDWLLLQGLYQWQRHAIWSKPAAKLRQPCADCSPARSPRPKPAQRLALLKLASTIIVLGLRRVSFGFQALRFYRGNVLEGRRLPSVSPRGIAAATGFHLLVHSLGKQLLRAMRYWQRRARNLRYRDAAFRALKLQAVPKAALHAMHAVADPSCRLCAACGLPPPCLVMSPSFSALQEGSGGAVRLPVGSLGEKEQGRPSSPLVEGSSSPCTSRSTSPGASSTPCGSSSVYVEVPCAVAGAPMREHSLGRPRSTSAASADGALLVRLHQAAEELEGMVARAFGGCEEAITPRATLPQHCPGLPVHEGGYGISPAPTRPMSPPPTMNGMVRVPPLRLERLAWSPEPVAPSPAPCEKTPPSARRPPVQVPVEAVPCNDAAWRVPPSLDMRMEPMARQAPGTLRPGPWHPSACVAAGDAAAGGMVSSGSVREAGSSPVGSLRHPGPPRQGHAMPAPSWCVGLHFPTKHWMAEPPPH